MPSEVLGFLRGFRVLGLPGFGVQGYRAFPGLLKGLLGLRVAGLGLFWCSDFWGLGFRA